MPSKKKIADYDKLIELHIEQKHVVKVIREFKYGSDNIDGYILATSPTLLLLQVENDFMIDGYAVVPKQEFSSIRFNKVDRTRTKILKAEGIEEKLLTPENIDITNLQALFKSLKSSNKHVITECQHLSGRTFFLGPIVKVGRNKMSIQYYSATGRLEPNPTEIKYKDITVVKFDDHYSTIFRKYLKPPKSKAV